jgi:uncharacterized membrane protein YeaQ/YmgE (transglycosylase-associated protein family)
MGFILWIAIGLIGAAIMRFTYKVSGTDAWLTYTFGFYGAFIGGMLGSAANVHHDPSPMRMAGIIGAVVGALFFTAVYHMSTKRLV